MISKYHAKREEEGFTLIELLVVIIIIGILAAIAIPTFLGQRERARRSAVQSDLRNAAVAMETYFTDFGFYAGATAGPPVAAMTGTALATTVMPGLFKPSAGVVVTIMDANSTSFCAQAVIAGLPAADGGAWYFDSNASGALAQLRAHGTGAGACQAT